MKISDDSMINLHAILPGSRVNGPGNRMVIFFQGCSRECAGCFNPDTHSFEIRRLCSPQDILSTRRKNVEGITVSGGEPFLQPAGLLGLLKIARELDLTTVVYTGFRIEELDGARSACIPFIDVLVDGGYEEAFKETTLLARGSTNQRIHCLTGRYREADLYMPGKVEVVIDSNGVVTETGFSRIELRN
jgi:anaerobic ribonucleoside-triphosphate reductase activating protein